VVTWALSDLTRRVLPAENCLEGEGGAGALLGEGGAALPGEVLLGEDGALIGDGGALLGEGGALLGDGGALIGEGGALLGEGGALLGEGNAWLGSLVAVGGALVRVPPVLSVGSVDAFSLCNALVLFSAESLRFPESVEPLRLVDSVESLLFEKGSFFTTAGSSPG